MEKEKQQLNKIAKKYNLKLLLLFGSQTDKESLHQESDFDIAYLSQKELDIQKQVQLNCDLMKIFNSDKIDMVNLKKANPLLRYEIAKKNELLFGNMLDFLEFKARAFRIYVESESLFNLENRLIKRRQKLLEQSIYD